MEITLTNEIIEVSVTNDDELTATLSNEMIDVTLSNDAVYYFGSDHLEIDFSYEDWGLGKKKIGTALAMLRITEVVSLVNEDGCGSVFNEGTIVIGDENAHGRLMVAADSDLTKRKKYTVEPDVYYEANTDLYIYFETGAPTTGNGTVIIYLQ